MREFLNSEEILHLKLLFRLSLSNTPYINERIKWTIKTFEGHFKNSGISRLAIESHLSLIIEGEDK